MARSSRGRRTECVCGASLTGLVPDFSFEPVETGVSV